MNPHTRLVIALAASTSLGLTACGPNEEPKTQAGAPVSSTQVSEPTMVEKAVEAAKEATQNAGARLNEVAKDPSLAAAVEKGKEFGAVAVEKGKEALEKGKEMTAVAVEKTKEATSAAVEQGKELAAVATDKGNAMIQQAKDYIARNQPDLAQGVMDKLHQMKESLPEGVKSEIARLEAMMGRSQPALTPATATTPAPALTPAAATVTPPAAQ